jgi:uncharacterized flavoprotein (TIGR03862 family)
MKRSVAIIGSGPAALLAAAMLNENAFDVTIYERNFAPARKFLVAGDGGFNLTHSEALESFIHRYTPDTFLEKSIRSFTNTDLQGWLKHIGIETYTGTSKRIFPVKGIKPIEVLNAILEELKRKNVQVKTKHNWKGWNSKNELIIQHDTKELIVKADIVIFALGGASWTKTGSDGSWLEIFEKRGIEVLPFRASNCGYEIKWDKTFLEQAAGKSLKNISISCGDKEKKGELVITQLGIEGGAVYALSPQIRKQLEEKNTADIYIDLKPDLTSTEIKNKLSVKENKSLSTFLKEELNLSSIQLALLKTRLTKEEFTDMNTLAGKIKQLHFSITAMAPVEEAISTVGGIALSAVKESFELKKIPDQYVIGEMLNWDAPTGGYLIQACFSMGYYVAQGLNSGLKK